MRQDPLNLTLLLDYYGELLPEKQRTYCDLSYNQDYSLAEIAQCCGISRQGVHDALSHAEAALREFERLLGCAARDAKLRAAVHSAQTELTPLLLHTEPQIREAAQRVTSVLQTILE